MSLMKVAMTAKTEINNPTVISVNPSVRSRSGKNEDRRLAAKIIAKVKNSTINTFGSMAIAPACRASWRGLYEELVGSVSLVFFSPDTISPPLDSTKTT